jgi:ACS family D-galactonate transporter-like MFS transporter
VTASLAIFTLVVPATSILVDQGTRVQEIVTAHPQEVAVLSAIDPETSKALTADPTDLDALSTALGAIAREQGASEQEAAAVAGAVHQRAPQLAAAQAVDPATLATLQSNPFDSAAQASAIGDIMSGVGVDQAQATQLLISLGAPEVQKDLAQIQAYATTLKAATAAIPADDLAYLSANGAKVAQAQEDNGSQWQRWWWVCIAGQLLFLPFVFVMAGRWSPKKAREDELEHERRVQQELAALGSSSS